MNSNPHVPRFYVNNVEEIVRRDSISHHASKVLQESKSKEAPDGKAR